MTAWKEKWESLSPTNRKRAAMLGAGAVAVVLLGVLLSMGNQETHTRRTRAQDVSNVLTDADPQEMGVKGLSRKLNELRGQVADLTEQAKRWKSAQPDGQLPSGLTSKLDALQNRMSHLETKPEPASAGSTMAQHEVEPTLGPPETSQAAPETLPDRPTPKKAAARQAPPATIWNRESAPGSGLGPASTGSAPPNPIAIRTIEAPAPSHADDTTPKEAKSEVPVAYLPSGSIITGVMLNGLDAPTGRAANQEPIPVLIRIKHNALLPNRFQQDLRECFILAAGYGDLSSERAYLRAERISCVRADKKAIDMPLEAYAVGEDGKAGLRGRLVSKQGKAMGKAMLAGFADAFSRGLRPSGFGVGDGVDLQRTTAFGVAGGVSSAMDRVAKFYINMANQMFPVVEISGGRKVSFNVIRGMSLPTVHTE
jgi:conjugal transfer pilus assembly protein TraB